MAEGRIKNTELSAIANAIRQKNGSSTTYKPSEMAAAIAAIPMGTTPTGTVNITQNGTTDVTQYASAAVNVPNSYSQSDEGKVVSNGALVAQTSGSATENGIVDTTLINSLTVNVSGGGGGGTVHRSTTDPTSQDGADGDVWIKADVQTVYHDAVYVSISGGYNGGAIIRASDENNQTLFQATGDSPYNLAYTPSAGTFIVGGTTYTITITPPASSSSSEYVVATVSNGIESKSFSSQPAVGNSSYGYDSKTALIFYGSSAEESGGALTIYERTNSIWDILSHCRLSSQIRLQGYLTNYNYQEASSSIFSCEQFKAQSGHTYLVCKPEGSNYNKFHISLFSVDLSTVKSASSTQGIVSENITNMRVSAFTANQDGFFVVYTSNKTSNCRCFALDITGISFTT